MAQLSGYRAKRPFVDEDLILGQEGSCRKEKTRFRGQRREQQKRGRLLKCTDKGELQ